MANDEWGKGKAGSGMRRPGEIGVAISRAKVRRMSFSPGEMPFLHREILITPAKSPWRDENRRARVDMAAGVGHLRMRRPHG